MDRKQSRSKLIYLTKTIKQSFVNAGQDDWLGDHLGFIVENPLGFLFREYLVPRFMTKESPEENKGDEIGAKDNES